MKLYLSSYFLGNHPEELAKLVGSNKKVGIVMNAADIYGNEKHPTYLANETEKMKTIGLDAEELDLRNYFNNNEALEAKLESYGLVWVMGGNTFALRQAMRMSGFDLIIKDLVADEALVYGGFSAGSVVATQTLKGIELVDYPKQMPEGYNKEIIWEGLGFVDFSIAPHYRSEHPESEAIEKVVQYFRDNKLPYKALRDGEVLIINGTNLSLFK
ncbi:MAG: peptidase E [bacterium]|nr:peptidase E [bacterium]